MTDGISFGQTIDLLGNAIHGSTMEHEQIANNLANVNTPGFRRSTTNFRDALAASLATPADPDALAMATDDSRHFAINGAQPAEPFNPQAHVDETLQMRVDKSNVDVDQEMAKLSFNSGYEQTMAQLLSEQYGRMRIAITEQTK